MSDDGATWAAARDLVVACQELTDRLYAGEFVADEYQEALLELLAAASPEVTVVARRILRASNEALRRATRDAEV